MIRQVQPLQITTSLIRGRVSWDLPESMQYTPGDTIPITFTITNPTDEARLYFIGLALIRNGELIDFGGVEIGDIEDWVVEPNSSNEISYELSPEFTDCYLNATLIGGLSEEEEELEVIEEIVDSLTTYLYLTAEPTVQPLEVQVMSVQTAITVLMVIGFVCYGVAGLLKGVTGEGIK